jgi:hypothetical protein
LSVQNFIPTVWSAKLFQTLDKSHVLVNRCNRDYEGEISDYGDSVKINAIGEITIGNYQKNVTSITPEQLDDAQTILNIDQAKYFAFYVDDVDQAQTKPKVMGEAMRKAGYALADTADRFIAAKYSEAGNTVTGAGSTAVTSARVVGVLGYAGQLLDEKNVPTQGRWMVVPPWFHTKLVLAKILQTDGSVVADPEFANGYIGRAMGFDIYLSNNITTTGTVPNVTSYVMAGHPRAISFAEQIVKMEAYRPENSFSDAVKGLHVYGGKVIDPNALVSITAIYSSEA